MTVEKLIQPQMPSIIGPALSGNHVVIEGRNIPRLHARDLGERVELILDGRFAAVFDANDAHQAAWLIANALAIGEGYPFLGAPTKDRPFAPEVHMLDAPEDA